MGDGTLALCTPYTGVRLPLKGDLSRLSGRDMHEVAAHLGIRGKLAIGQHFEIPAKPGPIAVGGMALQGHWIQIPGVPRRVIWYVDEDWVFELIARTAFLRILVLAGPGLCRCAVQVFRIGACTSALISACHRRQACFESSTKAKPLVCPKEIS